MTSFPIPCTISIVYSIYGLDKICLAKFEQNGKPEERSNSAKQNGLPIVSKKARLSGLLPANNYFYTSTMLDLPLPDLLPVTYNVILQRFTAQQQSIFGRLPGTLCYVAIEPCSLDSL